MEGTDEGRGRPMNSGNDPLGRQEILKASLDCPLLHEAVNRWRAGCCTFEEAMSAAAVVMSKTINELQRELMKDLEERNPAFWFDSATGTIVGQVPNMATVHGWERDSKLLDRIEAVLKSVNHSDSTNRANIRGILAERRKS